MSVDQAYNYFREAFSEWVAAMEINGKAAQKEIADLLEINKSTAHRYVKGTRNIPFEKQVQIANESGFDYLDFLIYGKQLLNQEPICKPSLPEESEPQAQGRGGAKLEPQGDKNLKAVFEMFQQEKDRMRADWKAERAELKAEIAELKAKVETLQTWKDSKLLEQHRSPAKQGREQGRTPDKRTANGQ